MKTITVCGKVKWLPLLLAVAFPLSGCRRADGPSGMVLIPGGTNSGRNPLARGESHNATQYPATYSQTVNAFYMDKNPVTKALWDEVYAWATHADRGANVYSFVYSGSGKAADHPVQNVNWYDVVKWCNARSEKEGLTRRQLVI